MVSNDHFHQETNEFKILDAYGVPGGKYSNFKVYTGHLMCPQFKLSAEIFFLFSLWLNRAHRFVQEKLCFNPPTFKKHFPEKAQDTIIFKNERK